MRYLVSEIFWSVQGEGSNTGATAVFVRLAGCNLACDFCDTKYAWGRDKAKELSTREIVDRIKELPPSELVILTGGEPTIQDLGELIFCIRMNLPDRQIAMETNGTEEWKPVYRYCFITVSPKPPHKAILASYDEVKFVVTATNEIPDLKSEYPFASKYYLQPVDNNPEAVARCLEFLKHNSGYRLSSQMHKLLAIK